MLAVFIWHSLSKSLCLVYMLDLSWIKNKRSIWNFLPTFWRRTAFILQEVYANYYATQSEIMKLYKCTRVLTNLNNYEIGSKSTQEPLLFLANWSAGLQKKSKCEHTYPNIDTFPEVLQGPPALLMLPMRMNELFQTFRVWNFLHHSLNTGGTWGKSQQEAHPYSICNQCEQLMDQQATQLVRYFDCKDT